jgi:hypothetical protein
MLYTHCDSAQNILFHIITMTVAWSPRSAWVPHELVPKRAPVSIGGVECGFLKEVNRPSPETDRQFLLVSTLPMCERGAVSKLTQYVLIEWCSISIITIFCTNLPPVGKPMQKCFLILYKLVYLSVFLLPSLTFIFSANYLSMLSSIPLLLDLFVVKKIKTITRNKFLYACLIWIKRELQSVAK